MSLLRPQPSWLRRPHRRGGEEGGGGGGLSGAVARLRPRLSELLRPHGPDGRRVQAVGGPGPRPSGGISAASGAWPTPSRCLSGPRDFAPLSNPGGVRHVALQRRHVIVMVTFVPPCTSTYRTYWTIAKSSAARSGEVRSVCDQVCGLLPLAFLSTGDTSWSLRLLVECRGRFSLLGTPLLKLLTHTANKLAAGEAYRLGRGNAEMLEKRRGFFEVRGDLLKN